MVVNNSEQTKKLEFTLYCVTTIYMYTNKYMYISGYSVLDWQIIVKNELETTARSAFTQQNVYKINESSSVVINCDTMCIITET